LGWECPFSCPLEPWWLQRGSPASSHQPADALDLSCRSLPAVFVEPDTSAAVEMDGFLLTVPCVCPPVKLSPGISIARTEGWSTAAGNAG